MKSRLPRNLALSIALVLGFALPAAIAQTDKSAPEAGAAQRDEGWRKDMDERLSRARERMEAAAREVGELSAELMGSAVDFARMPWREERASLGVNVSLMDDQDKKDGLSILGVSPGGPGDKAGLEHGDVLTAINGKSLAGVRPKEALDVLIGALEAVKPGDKVKVEYRRGDKTMQAEVTTEALRPMMVRTFIGGGPGPGGDVFFNRAGPPGASPGEPGMPFFDLPIARRWGDMELVELSSTLGEYFGTDKGVLVVRAPRDRDLKLEDGDVILAIDGRNPTGPGHALRILGSYAGGETLELEVMRKKRRQTLKVALPDRGPEGRGAAVETAPGPGTVRTFTLRREGLDGI